MEEVCLEITKNTTSESPRRCSGAVRGEWRPKEWRCRPESTKIISENQGKIRQPSGGG